MKRSEMIELIAKTYNNSTLGDEFMSYPMASRILTAMESVGIQPPGIMHSPSIKFSGFNSITLYEWEPEDEGT